MMLHMQWFTHHNKNLQTLYNLRQKIILNNSYWFWKKFLTKIMTFIASYKLIKELNYKL